MTGHLTVALGTTWCPDTPENWSHFHRLKSRLGKRISKPGKSSSNEELNKAIQQQISRENKSLRAMRTFLPGHEPDRICR